MLVTYVTEGCWHWILDRIENKFVRYSCRIMSIIRRFLKIAKNKKIFYPCRWKIITYLENLEMIQKYKLDRLHISKPKKIKTKKNYWLLVTSSFPCCVYYVLWYVGLVQVDLTMVLIYYPIWFKIFSLLRHSSIRAYKKLKEKNKIQFQKIKEDEQNCKRDFKMTY